MTTALDTAEHIREVLDGVDSRWVRANFDPVNLLGSFGAVWSNGQAMRHMWDVLGAYYTPSAHIKDVVADPDLVVHISEAPPGHGLLDLDVFFEICTNLGDETAVIVEHLPADQARDRDRVREAGGRAARHSLRLVAHRCTLELTPGGQVQAAVQPPSVETLGVPLPRAQDCHMIAT